MHWTTLATSTSALLSRQFWQNALNRNTHEIGPSMNTISGNNVILFSHWSLHADSNGLLAWVQMAKASNNLLLVEITRWRFKATNGLHLSVHIECIITTYGEAACWCGIESMRFKLLGRLKKQEGFYLVFTPRALSHYRLYEDLNRMCKLNTWFIYQWRTAKRTICELFINKNNENDETLHFSHFSLTFAFFAATLTNALN